MGITKRLLPLIFVISSTGISEPLDSGPNFPGILPDSELSDELIPADRVRKPVADESINKAFAKLHADLASLLFQTREEATRELKNKLSSGKDAERFAWLSLALDAMESESTVPEVAQIRIPRAIAEAGLSLDTVDWVAGYCRWVEGQADSLSSEAAAFNSILEVFDNPRTVVVDAKFEKALEHIQVATIEVEKAKSRLASIRASTPKALQDESEAVKKAQKNYDKALEELAHLNENGSTVKQAEAYRDSMAKLLEKAGFEVEPTFVSTAMSAMVFVVKKGDKKQVVEISPVPMITPENIGRGMHHLVTDAVETHSFAIKVFPAPPTASQAKVGDFLDPVMSLRYDFGSVPTFAVPPVGIGGTVAVRQDRRTGLEGISGRRVVTGPELVGRTSVKTGFQPLAEPKEFLTAVYPQLAWSLPLVGNHSEKAEALREKMADAFQKKQARTEHACGKLKPVPSSPLLFAPVDRLRKRNKVLTIGPIEVDVEEVLNKLGNHLSTELEKRKR